MGDQDEGGRRRPAGAVGRDESEAAAELAGDPVQELRRVAEVAFEVGAAGRRAAEAVGERVARGVRGRHTSILAGGSCRAVAWVCRTFSSGPPNGGGAL
jgi:hypothetical protein